MPEGQLKENATQNDLHNLHVELSALNKKLETHHDVFTYLRLYINDANTTRKRLCELEESHSDRRAVLRMIFSIGTGVILIVLAGELWSHNYFWSGVGSLAYWSGICMIAGSIVYASYVFSTAVFKLMGRGTNQGT